MARYLGAPGYWPGVVDAVNEAGGYSIHFDDGDKDQNVSESHVLPPTAFPPSAAAAASAPPRPSRPLSTEPPVEVEPHALPAPPDDSDEPKIYEAATADASDVADVAAAARGHDEPLFRVGEVVDVAPRTNPGFNYQGGTAKINKVNDEREGDSPPLRDGSKARTTGFTYGVRYVMGGSERRVDAQWITSKDGRW